MVRSAIVVTTRPVPQLVTLQVGALMETVSVSGVAEGPPRELAEPVLPDSTGCVPFGVDYSEPGIEANRQVFSAHRLDPNNVICADFFAEAFQAQHLPPLLPNQVAP